MARMGGGRGQAARMTPRRSVDRLTVEFIDTNSSNHINRLISDHHGCRRVGRRAPRRRGRLSTSTPWRAGCRSEPSTSSPANARPEDSLELYCPDAAPHLAHASIAFRVGQQEGNDGLLPLLERFKRDAALSALEIRTAGGGAVVDAAGGGAPDGGNGRWRR
uniref:Uncharacterized protein n=1 Tax=Oryza sativa subsp. japonica TaxID=39947 RepID=H2KWW3_ORYSJ|nr:hypothetical protein LOC_Os12g35364 [Oryza sativa Japonica Group]